MCKIKDFLINHPGISVRWLEQQVSIPIGTIRIRGNKPIPDKYIQPLIKVLSDYGYTNTDVQTSDKPTVPTGKAYIYRNKGFGYWDKSGQWNKWIPVTIPEDTTVYIP